MLVSFAGKTQAGISESLFDPDSLCRKLIGVNESPNFPKRLFFVVNFF
jgi:hypothetical protein